MLSFNTRYETRVRGPLLDATFTLQSYKGNENRKARNVLCKSCYASIEN